MNKEKSSKLIHFRTDIETSNKIKLLSKRNGSNSMTNTIQAILDYYFELEGLYKDPSNNVFLNNFKNQISHSMNQLIDNQEKYLNDLIKSINELNENVIQLISFSKENSVNTDLLISDVRELIGGDTNTNAENSNDEFDIE